MKVHREYQYLVEKFNTMKDRSSEIQFLPFSARSYIKAFKQKTIGTPLKLVTVGDFAEGISLPDKFLEFFYKKTHVFVSLSECVDSVAGIFMKDVFTKEFYYFPFIKLSFYGFYNFHDFNYGDRIVVVEGVKDLMFVKRIYPYAIAVLTSNISRKMFSFLSYLTDRVVVIFDADEAGKLGAKAAIKHAINYKMKIISVNLPNGVKDLGEYFEQDELVKHRLQLFGTGLKEFLNKDDKNI